MSIENEYLNILSMRLPHKSLRFIFVEKQQEEHPCEFRSMWRAVITQALMDAGSKSKDPEDRKHKMRAISWLNGESDDFKEVCVMADLDVGYVKRKAKEAIKRGCKWRADGRKKKIKKRH